MKFQERKQVILELLQKQNMVRAEELSKLFGVSLVTIRKDLQKMEDDGLLVRTFGGAASCTVDSTERQRIRDMQAIADFVGQEIKDGECIILNAGTTNTFTARNLRGKHLKVVTNAVSIARELNGYEGIKVILLGGEMKKEWAGDVMFTYGSETIEQMMQFKADKVILSASGISCARGITTRYMEATELFREMMGRAKEVIVVADGTKIGFESFYHVSDLDVIDKLVTNRQVQNEEELQQLEKMGVPVWRC